MLDDEYFSICAAHFDLEQRFSRLIRAGYVGHESFELEFEAGLERILRISRQDSAFRSLLLVPTQGYTIIGMSDIGKWRII